MGKSNERILCKLSNGEILRLYLIVHVAIETTKTSNFTCQSNFLISIFFICQVSACELQPFSCHNLANDLYSETAKTVFSHLNRVKFRLYRRLDRPSRLNEFVRTPKCFVGNLQVLQCHNLENSRSPIRNITIRTPSLR